MNGGGGGPWRIVCTHKKRSNRKEKRGGREGGKAETSAEWNRA